MNINLKMLVPLVLSFALAIHAGVAKPSPRIVGGLDAEPGQFPFSVSLKDARMEGLICGASIINEYYLLTAGQCVYNKRSEDLRVYIGSIYSDHDGNYSQVDRFIIHPDYDPMSLANDVSLIKLKEPVQFGDKVQPANLPINVTLNSGDKVTALGWGYVSVDGETNQLHYLNTKIVDEEKCSVIWDSNISPSQICFGGNGGQGACYGDSGSPVVYKSNNETYIVGIISWGKPCAEGYPDVNTKISYYVSWIQEQLTQE